MTTLSRKQRDIAAREQLILDAARRMLVEDGYLNLTMDRIADAVEYSKGTIYQHFANKEDVVGALAVETSEMRYEMFRRGASFDGRPRERMAGIGVADQIFVTQFPDHFRTEQIVEVGSIYDKISDDMRQSLEQLKQQGLDVLLEIVQDAAAAGHLVLGEKVPECQLLYGLWSMATGHAAQTVCARIMSHFADMDLNEALWANYNTLLDGYGWQPLSSQWDYAASVERIKMEVFSDELLPEPPGSDAARGSNEAAGGDETTGSDAAERASRAESQPAARARKFEWQHRRQCWWQRRRSAETGE